MQPFTSVVTLIGAALVAVLRRLLEGLSSFGSTIAFWIRPPQTARKTMDKAELPSGSDTARLVEAFLKEATELLSFGPSSPDDVAGTDQLKRFAMALKSQFRERLRDGAAACMLPSYNHTLPTGAEHGRFLALDVGGSTLRVALVELRGRPAEQDRGSGTLGRAEGEGAGDGPTASIVRMKSFVIDDAVKGLVGRDFFDWIAERIVETVESALQNDERQDPDAEIPIGLAWSFPIE